MSFEIQKECCRLVADFFKDDPFKALVWWTTPNPLLGELTPIWFLNNGKEEKILRMIKNLLAGNHP